MAKAIAIGTTIATINGLAAYCASSSDSGSIPASTPKPIRTPGLLIMIPPTMNMMPVTIAADVPIWWGLTTSAAVLGGNWSAKLEYDFLKLDDLTFGPGPFRGDTFPGSREIQMFKVGLNYRFGSLFGGGYGGSY